MKKIDPLILLFLIIQISVSCGKTRKNDKEVTDNSVTYVEYAHYEIDLHIDPKTQNIMVQGYFKPGTTDSNAGDIFYLDRNMEIQYFGQKSKNTYRKDTILSDIKFMPEASKICPENLSGEIDRNHRVEFSYSGKLSKLPEYFANTVTEDWVEIGLYYPWFPYNTDIKLFTYKLNVIIDKSYKVFGIGNVLNTDSEWIIETSTPTNDIVICATQNIDIRQWIHNKNAFLIYYENLNDTVVDKLQTDLTNIMEALNNRYGEKKQNTIITKSKRTKGGGYARIGRIFLGGLDQEANYSNQED